MTPFVNSDEKLLARVDEILADRKRTGLEGLVGGLEAVIINTQPDLLGAAVQNLLDATGYQLADAFEDIDHLTYVLTCPGSADILVRSRLRPPNPFAAANDFPVGRRLPDTRLETFVFAVKDLAAYVEIQRGRGIAFQTERPVVGQGFRFIQSWPSVYTGNATGFVQWSGPRGDWRTPGSRRLDRRLKKPDRPFLANIGRLDHCATRVRAQDRDAAILEFMSLTNYRFSMAIYVECLNSITNVSRLGKEDFALVFTSGISPFVDEATSGPTEKFAHTYGPRVHHMAFDTNNIEAVIEGLRQHGQRYLDEMVGSPEEGLKQIFTVPFQTTLLVNEYIHRYGDFDGFFTKQNVTLLTQATSRQD